MSNLNKNRFNQRKNSESKSCLLSGNDLKTDLFIFRSLMNQASDAFYIVDPKTSKVLDANQKACVSLGYTRQELIGKEIVDIDAIITSLALWHKHLGETKRKKSVLFESVHRRKDKTTFPVELNVKYILVGGKGYMLGQARDITARKEIQAKLTQQQTELELSRKSIQNFSHQILAIREEEKKNLSMDLHDEVGSMTVALSAALRLAEDEIRNNNQAQAIRYIHQGVVVLRDSAASLKKMAVNLRPPNMDIIGLPAALEDFFSEISIKHKLLIDYRVNIGKKPLADKLAIAIYRIIQEAFNNITHHAHADKVLIRLDLKNKKILLKIKDNGQGFDLSKYFRQQNRFKIGIKGMKERVETFNGKFNIKSVIDSGTIITISIPV